MSAVSHIPTSYTMEYKIKVLLKLEELSGNVSATAKFFGIHRKQVITKMTYHSLALVGAKLTDKYYMCFINSLVAKYKKQ